MPSRSSRRTASKRYGKSSLLTTKPAASGTSTAVFSSRSQRRCSSSFVSAVASSGKDSSTSFIFSTGLNTWSAAKRSGRPLAAAISATESEDVVVATIVSAGSSSPSWRWMSHLTAVSSATASTTMSQSASVAEVGDHARGPDLLGGSLGGLLAARPDDHLVVLVGGPREAASDRSATDYSQLMSQIPPLVD